MTLGRRDFLTGIGGVALTSLLRNDAEAAGGIPTLPHYAAKAKRVICLYMSGGISQLDSFDYKPKLTAMAGKPIPDSVFKGRKPLGMSKLQSSFLAQGSAFPFQQYGQSGAWVSSVFPHLAKHADKLCFLKGMVSDAVNHDPAIIFSNSGSQLPGRPVMGSWLSYGLGTENQNLPAFVVMVTKKPADQPLSSRLWDSAFLPSEHQGTPFRAGKEPVLYLTNPSGVSMPMQRRMLDTVKVLQEDELSRRAESEISARIAQYELAYRMQSAVPGVIDLTKESPSTLAYYGPQVNSPGSFARNCLIARRMAESGVRFIQLYHPGWDLHAHIYGGVTALAQEADQPMAGLLQDLSERDMLKDTLVLFMTEFGRTPYAQGGGSEGDKELFGREHHRYAFSYWMAGAGVKPGMTYGATDDLGFDVVDGKVTVNDFHATVMHLLGIDHERFTYRSQGRDYRLTDVAGNIVKPILA
jgi:hypothetical protein